MIMGGRVEIAFCFFQRWWFEIRFPTSKNLYSLQLQDGPLPDLNGVISYNFYK